MSRRTTTSRSTPGWLKLFSFIAVMLLGLALVISVVLGKWIHVSGAVSVAKWIEKIAIAIALVVPLFLSYYEARYNKSQVWFILWIIAVILIVVFYILAIVL